MSKFIKLKNPFFVARLCLIFGIIWFMNTKLDNYVDYFKVEKSH